MGITPTVQLQIDQIRAKNNPSLHKQSGQLSANTTITAVQQLHQSVNGVSSVPTTSFQSPSAGGHTTPLINSTPQDRLTLRELTMSASSCPRYAGTYYDDSAEHLLARSSRPMAHIGVKHIDNGLDDIFRAKDRAIGSLAEALDIALMNCDNKVVFQELNAMKLSIVIELKRYGAEAVLPRAWYISREY